MDTFGASRVEVLYAILNHDLKLRAKFGMKKDFKNAFRRAGENPDGQGSFAYRLRPTSFDTF